MKPLEEIEPQWEEIKQLDGKKEMKGRGRGQELYMQRSGVNGENRGWNWVVRWRNLNHILEENSDAGIEELFSRIKNLSLSCDELFVLLNQFLVRSIFSDHVFTLKCILPQSLHFTLKCIPSIRKYLQTGCVVSQWWCLWRYQYVLWCAPMIGRGRNACFLYVFHQSWCYGKSIPDILRDASQIKMYIFIIIYFQQRHIWRPSTCVKTFGCMYIPTFGWKCIMVDGIHNLCAFHNGSR